MGHVRSTFAMVFLAIAAAGCTSIAHAASTQGDDLAAKAFVEAFFAAVDARDMSRISRAFASDAMIVHADGVSTSVGEFLKIIQDTKEWIPRTRELSSYTTRPVGGALIVGFLNHVTFKRDGRERAYTYNETWVLERTDSGLRAVRAHYSRVVADKHTE